MITRLMIFTYGIISYAIGMAGLVWFILFISPFSDASFSSTSSAIARILPSHINSAEPGPLSTALWMNMSLILIFGLQHSLMARASFKAQLTRIIPQAAERSTYVLLSGVVMALFCLYWQPIEGSLWQVEQPIGKIILISGYIAGWSITFISTFLINHFELFGLQQIYCNLKKQPVPNPDFTDRFFYKLVRHPLQFGVLLGLWSTPYMTMTHLTLALAMTVYIFIGLYYEEKDLVASLGEDYVDYQKRTHMILPIPKK